MVRLGSWHVPASVVEADAAILEVVGGVDLVDEEIRCLAGNGAEEVEGSLDIQTSKGVTTVRCRIGPT